MKTKHIPQAARHKQRNRGFSLIELVIVITIMVVLTALLAPQLLRYVEKSREAKDAQNVATLIKAFELMAVDYGSGEAGTGTVKIVNGGECTYHPNGELKSINASIVRKMQELLGPGEKPAVGTTYYLPPLVSKAYAKGVWFKFLAMNADGSTTNVGTDTNGGMFKLTYKIN